jgi:hypothetical protein
MALWPLNGVEAIVLHAGFLDRLNHREIGLAAALRGAKGLAAIVNFLKAADAQRGIAPTDNIAAHPVGSCVDAPVDARDLLMAPAMIGCSMMGWTPLDGIEVARW